MGFSVAAPPTARSYALIAHSGVQSLTSFNLGEAIDFDTLVDGSPDIIVGSGGVITLPAGKKFILDATVNGSTNSDLVEGRLQWRNVTDNELIGVVLENFAVNTSANRLGSANRAVATIDTSSGPKDVQVELVEISAGVFTVLGAEGATDEGDSFALIREA